MKFQYEKLKLRKILMRLVNEQIFLDQIHIQIDSEDFSGSSNDFWIMNFQNKKLK